jgi:heme exporter protein D
MYRRSGAEQKRLPRWLPWAIGAAVLVALNVMKFRSRSEILAKIDALRQEEQKAKDKLQQMSGRFTLDRTAA